jgi:hypothetical protein
MGEQRQEPGSSSRTSALHRAGGHVEDAGCLRDRVALHVHQDERGTLVGRQGSQGFDELPVEIVALGWCRGRLMRLQELLQALSVVDGRGLP